MEKISFVIPCYRSEHTIQIVVTEILQVMSAHQDYDYEIVLVSDHSPDHVYDVIKRIASQNERVKGMEFARNFGQHAALLAGYRHCTGDYIVSLDDDGQTPANEVFLLIDKLKEGYDVVFAKYETIQQSGFRRFGSKVNAWMAETMIGKPKTVYANSYFVMRKYVRDEVVRYQNPYPYISGLVFRCTQNIANVEIHQRKRMEGNSGYNLAKLFSMWLNGFTAFSIKPLRLATFAGMVTAGLGFLYGIYIIITKFIRPTVPMGYSSTMATLLFLGGMLMMIMGMIGEYIGRIYICINQSPQYVIREEVNTDKV